MNEQMRQLKQVNLNHTLGACCNEMALWEADAYATSFAAYPCNISCSPPDSTSPTAPTDPSDAGALVEV
jgi:hypothetical protein